jgi:hypothetical protein
MALQLRVQRSRRKNHLSATLIAIFALLAQPFVALNVPSVFAAPVINEVMPKPVGITEADGEWIEVYNKGVDSTDVSGWTLSDNTGVRYTFAPETTLADGQYFVVCSDKAVNIEVMCDDEWSGGNILNNSGDTLTLSDGTGLIDSFVYAASDVTAGKSIEVVREDNTTTATPNTSQSYDTEGNSGTPGKKNATVSTAPVTNQNTGEQFTTIQKAIDDADTLDGHTIMIADGTYDENPNLGKSLSFVGKSESGVVINADNGGYGFENTEPNLDMSFTSLTLANASTYGFKLTQGNATFTNVTVKGSGQSEFDFNGMNVVKLTNVTADGLNTTGNGISVSNTKTVEIDGAKTTNNNWGGVALYPNGPYYTPGIDSVMIKGLKASESNELYQQIAAGGTAVGTLNAPQYKFGVTNDEFRADGEQFTFYQRNFDLASSFALGLQVGNTDSAIHRLSNGMRLVPTNGLTIKAAVEDAPADGTVKLLAGTHEADSEQIVIDKNLTLRGAGKANTIVKAQFDTGSSDDLRGWFLVWPGVKARILQLTLDGAGQKVYQAIRHKGSGNINNVSFKNILFNPSTSYAGTAVAALGNGATHITNSTFENIGRVGVLYFGAGVDDSRFARNTYTGKGVGDWLDYALDISAGAKVRVAGNTITNNLGVAESDGSTSAGILVSTFFGLGTQARISNNTITGNTTGMYVGFDEDDDSKVVARGNTIEGNQYGAISTNRLADFRNNWWGDNSGPTDDVSDDDSRPATNPGGTGDRVVGHIWYDDWTTVDATAPNSPAATFTEKNSREVIGNGGYASEQHFTFNLSNDDSEGVKRYELKYWNDIDSSRFKENSPWSHNISSSGVYPDEFTQGEGTHFFSFVACDAADNCSEEPTVFEVVYDKTNPVAKIVHPTDTNVASGVVEIKGEVTDENPMNSYFRITGPDGYSKTSLHRDGRTTHSFDWDTANLVSGEYTIFFATRDQAGNRDNGTTNTKGASIDEITVIVDNTAPKAQLDDMASSVKGVVDVTGIVTDDWKLKHYNLSLYPGSTDLSDGQTHSSERINPSTSGWGTTTANGTSKNVAAKLDTNDLTDGETYQIRLAVRDAAGNRDTSSTGGAPSSVHVISFVVDNTAPVLSMNQEYLVNDNGTYTISGTTTDSSTPVILSQNGSQVAEVTPEPNGEWSYTTTLDPGGYTFDATSTDTAGNKSEAVARTYSFEEDASTETTEGDDEGATRSNDTFALSAATNTPVPLLAPNTFAQSVALPQRALGAQLFGSSRAEQTVSDASVDEQTESGVLAAEDNTLEGGSTTESDQEDCWDIFGLCWYWWLAIVGGLVALWYLVRALRRAATGDSN